MKDEYNSKEIIHNEVLRLIYTTASNFTDLHIVVITLNR